MTMRFEALQSSVAEQFLNGLRRHGVRHIFGNAGTDFPPIIEALSRGEGGIDPVVVPHENVAVAMAYGAYLATGRPQVVMVHVGLGTANAVLGLINAARQHIPLILVAGRTPTLEYGKFGARNNYINWAQEMFDQGAMVREMVKWDYELRDPAQVDDVVDRAFAVAQSAPEGPAYIVLPREVLAAKAPQVADRGGLGRQAPVRLGLPPEDDISRCRQWLTEAKRPLIITADAGRDLSGFDALTKLSSELSVPVVQYRPRFLNIPCSSKVHAGYDAVALLPDADLVLVIDCDVPWIPETTSPSTDAKIVQIGRDPLCLDYPMRNFKSNLTLQGDTAAILRALDQASAPVPAERAAWLRKATHRPVATPSKEESPALTSRYVSRCLAEAMDENCVLVNEYTFTLEDLNIDAHGRYFAHSPAGGLGWAMGTALGIRLAQPETTVIATVGDGTYMFSNPTPAHFVSAARGLPFITVIYNNRRWAAVHRATLSLYPQGAAAAQEEPVFATLEPAPDYERIVEASGGLGLRVTEADQLPAAIARAMQAVRKERRQVVLNVLTDVTYTRTS